MSQIIRDTNNIRIDKGSGLFPKSLFIGFAVIGAILIWFLKGSGIDQKFIMIIPVLLIIIYCILAYNYRLFYLTEEKIGDNAYYLGFLYTLSSLSNALYHFTANENASEQIISSFSLALWSTIAGIACRVFLSQLRQDPNDIENEARVRIADTANFLTSELHQATISFNVYRRGLEQSIEEAFHKINGKVHESLSTSVDLLVSTTDVIAKQIENRFEELNENSKKLNTATSRSTSSIDKMNERIETVFSTIELSSVNINSIAKNQSVMIEKVSSTFNSLVSIVRSLSDQLSALKERSNHLTTVSQNLDKFEKNIAVCGDSLNEVANNQLNVVKAITDHANQLRDQLNRSRDYTQQTHQSLVDMTKTLAEKLG